jgi:hypothetical protein
LAATSSSNTRWGLGEHRVRPVGQERHDAVDGPGEVHRGRAGIAQPGDLTAQARVVPPLPLALRDGDRDAERPDRAERWGAADGEADDRIDERVDVGGLEVDLLDRQAGLVEQPHRRDRLVEPLHRPDGHTASRAVSRPTTPADAMEM